MVGGQFGEIEIFNMKSDDPSDFIECLSWDQAISEAGGYENSEIVSHYTAQFALKKPWLQRRKHTKLEDLVLSERQENLFFGFALAIVKLRKYKIRILDIGGKWLYGLLA